VDGYIKLHRKILENPVVCKDSEYFSVWLYLLLNATHKEYPAMFKGEKIMLQPGQLITGRISISDRFNISESKVKRILISLESDQQIERQRSNQNSLITILNWNIYQQSDQQNDQPVTSERPASDQPVTTNKNVKNVKNERSNTYSEIYDLYNTICISYPKLKSLSESRKKSLNARMKIYTIEDFKRLFEMAEESKFLKGGNDRSWSATFDWLIKDSNMAKVLDGNYNNKGVNNGQSGKHNGNGKPISGTQPESLTELMLEAGIE
jgi:hypothetical protein